MQIIDTRPVRMTLLAIVAIAIPGTAMAYIDPNSAGLLYQIFFPLVVAATLAWRWIKETCSVVWHLVLRRIRRLIG